jgi:hypothetical protein
MTYEEMLARLRTLNPAHRDAYDRLPPEVRTTVYRCIEYPPDDDEGVMHMTEYSARVDGSDPHVLWRVIAALRPSALVHRSTQEVVNA